MKRGIILALTVAVVLATAASTSSASPSAKYPKLFQFQSPSHNIGCALTKKYVRCDIREHTWPTPPKPADCDVDYGQGVALDQHGRGYVCAGDTTLDDTAPVLDYGDRISKGNIRCASKTKGMRCVNLDTKDGFFLSRDVVRLF